MKCFQQLNRLKYLRREEGLHVPDGDAPRGAVGPDAARGEPGAVGVDVEGEDGPVLGGDPVRLQDLHLEGGLQHSLHFTIAKSSFRKKI